MKKRTWYALPALPTVLIVTVAAALLFFVFGTGSFGPLAYRGSGSPALRQA